MSIAQHGRLEADVKGAARERIDKLPQISDSPLATAFRLDFSSLGSGDKLVDEQWVYREQRIRELVFRDAPEFGKLERARKSDLDHLLGHFSSGNDAFVTRDRKILDAREKLELEFGLVVLSPREAVRRIEGQ